MLLPIGMGRMEAEFTWQGLFLRIGATTIVAIFKESWRE
jgi:hypothetical protein